MSNPQFVSTMAVASALNTLSVIVGILINDSKLRSLRANVDHLFRHADGQSGGIDQCFDAIDRRFDEMRDLCRNDLRRFEDVIVARIKCLEELA